MPNQSGHLIMAIAMTRHSTPPITQAPAEATATRTVPASGKEAVVKSEAPFQTGAGQKVENNGHPDVSRTCQKQKAGGHHPCITKQKQKTFSGASKIGDRSQNRGTHCHQQHGNGDQISPNRGSGEVPVTERHALRTHHHLNKVDAENDAGQCRWKSGVGEVVKSPTPDLSGVGTCCGLCLGVFFQLLGLLLSGWRGGPHFDSAR